jgi:hypothetical protein
MQWAVAELRRTECGQIQSIDADCACASARPAKVAKLKVSVAKLKTGVAHAGVSAARLSG